MPAGVSRIARYSLLTAVVVGVADTIVRVLVLAVFTAPAGLLPLRGFTTGPLPFEWVPVVPFSTVGVVGSIFAIRRDLFRSAGGFDTAYRNGFEDVDLCLRLAREGDGILIGCSDHVAVAACG